MKKTESKKQGLLAVFIISLRFQFTTAAQLTKDFLSKMFCYIFNAG